ncbi:PAS domain-containing protein [Iodobacter fluviatilis]|uniref:Aerobic respiration control sensor protein ArcB n=1 Tax=Iodobacter fluviatilis TaxID=537 RepID=A0A377Q2R0_9NEIS|nr:PAS domain S-box protein [Iodobacter fluviatilis]TCU90529.1 PAS domain S-box-containing protein [Iodobacter fluviatilis]STQ89556.1 Aerobic respiration control sensor protein ArcB [Iodobacter fluviatilis]
MHRELKLPLTRILKTVLSYSAMAVLGMILSSKMIEMLLAARSSELEPLSLLKDSLMMLACILLLGLVWQQLLHRDIPRNNLSGYGKKLGGLFSVLAAFILIFSVASIIYRVNTAEEIHEARMQAIVDLKMRQISDWLKEREGDAALLQTSDINAALYQHWHTDPGKKTLLLQRLEQFNKIKGFQASSLLDSEGNLLWSSAQLPPHPALQITLQQAIRTQKIQRFGPYLNTLGQPSLDFIAPLNIKDGPAPFIILHSNPANWLFPALETQPVPSQTSDTVLFRQEGDQILFLNKPRFSKEPALTTKIAISKPLLASRFLSNKLPFNAMLRGRDYRNEKVMGIGRAVPDTDWYLICKMDQSEIYDEIIKDAIWISLVGLLALFMARASYVMLRQQEQLVLAANARQLQNERSQAVKLFSNIADNSEDAIFAKDMQGRYILINRAASRFVAQSVSDLLGKSDHDIFPPEQAEMLVKTGRIAIDNGIVLTQEETLDLPDGQHVFLATKGPLYDEKGKIIGLFGVSRDITERKQAEIVLRENEERFRAIVEQSLAGIYIIQRHRLNYVNPGFARIFAWDDADTLINMGDIGHLISAEDQERVHQLIRLAESGEISDVHFYFTGVRQDHELIDIEFYGRKVDDKGHPALIGLILDITERKSVEQTLTQQSEELRQRNAELERFNAAMVDRELDMIELKRQIKALSHPNTTIPSDDLSGTTP